MHAALVAGVLAAGALAAGTRPAAYATPVDFQGALEVVAAAYAANGDFHNASAKQQLAVQKAQGLGWNTGTLAERLDTYRHERAWHGDLLASL
jgi:hypothetical protein